MRVVGVTFVSNAIRLDFPVVPAIRSILPLCDELVVNVGPSTDETLALIQSVGDPRIRIIQGEWDSALGRRMLSAETQRALDAVQGDWAIYIQADEVLHENGLPLLEAALREAHDDARVEALLVDYVHFYGYFDTVATNRTWYRREARVVRLGCGVRSYEDAQGFRVGPEARPVRARRTGAVMHHYGWARPIEALRSKREVDQVIYHEGQNRRPRVPELPAWQVGLRRFTGTHPRVAREWIEERFESSAKGFQRPVWTRRMVQVAASDLLEKVTGWRAFEYRNYVEV
jgi:glycosyltransferase involved in cell wall biosynthesis